MNVFLFYECVFVGMNVFVLSVCLVLRGQKRASDLLEPQLQTVVSSHEHRELSPSPLTRATNALNL